MEERPYATRHETLPLSELRGTVASMSHERASSNRFNIS